jgi:ribosomal protein S12 methylthiotransferase accessory factor
MGQLFATALGRGADGGELPADPELSAWWALSTTEDLGYLFPDPRAAALTPDHYDYTPTTDLREDVEAISALTRARGLDLLVLDQTRPDIGIPAVKVIVPGLRHFWARFAPGRLFDVPVALGRLAEPTPYGALNPVPMFV